MNFFRGKKEDPRVELPNKIITLRNELTSEVNSYAADEDVARFLVARSYDVPKAKDMIIKWAEWWVTPIAGKNFGPKDVLKHLEDEKEHLYRDLFPQSNLGCDKEGHPIYWEKTGYVSKMFPQIKQVITEEDLAYRNVRQQELMVQRLKHASEKQGKCIGKQVVVFDLKDQVYSVDMSAFQVLRKTIAVQEAFYPERLKTCIIINAPIFFTALAAVIRPWLDPVTAGKIQVFGKNYIEKLKEFIDEDQIPVEYGGKRTNFSWKWPENYEE